MQLTLYKFSKRYNSTGVPSNGGTPVKVVLKKETSLNNPIFLLQGSQPDANYCAFNGAYYFIDDVRSVRNDLWEIVCTLDKLGTYRAEILTTTAFVDFATQGNPDIIDHRLGVEYGVAGVDTSITGGAIPYMDVDINDVGCFISVVGQTTTETYYITQTALESLFTSISNWSSNTIDDTDIITTLASAFKQLISSGSAADCVRDAYCLPIVAPVDVLAGAQSLKLGMFDTGIAANRIIGAGNVERTVSIAIPHHYADWRRQSPYEVCQLFLPLYGTINIPSDIAADNDSLTIRAILNVRSGDYTYYISGADRGGHEITVGGNCAAPLAVGASNVNIGRAVSAGLAMGTSLMLGNVPAAAASLMSIAPAPSSVGQAGGISNRSPRIVCMIYYRNTSAVPSTLSSVFGLPLQATKRMSDILTAGGGYVQTRNASVSGNIRGLIKQQINDMMDSGFFIE